MSINEKLTAIQCELNAPKNQHNDFGKYNYRSCEDILQAVKPLLKAHGCSLTLTDDILYVEGRHYVRATATLWDNESKDSIATAASAREEESKKGMDGSQVTGTASSYARKYALNGLFAIDDNKDADTNEFRKESEAKTAKESPKAEPKQEKSYECSVCGKPIKSFSDRKGKNYTPKDIADMTLKNYGKVMCTECSAKAKAGVL